MKKLKAFIFLLLLVAISACGEKSNNSEQTQNTLQKIQSTGKLKAGYFIQPPAVMKNPANGQVYGTFIDAISEIAEELKVELELIEVDLAKFSAGLKTGLYDVSIGPTFRTISRAGAVEFTDTIFYLGYDGVVKKGLRSKFPTENSIDQAGVTVAVKEGSAIHAYVENNFKNAKILVLSGMDLTLPLQAVSSAQADVGFMNEHTVEYYVRANRDVETILEDKPIQVLGMSWAVRQGDHTWKHFLDTSLEALIATGKMGEYEKNHYGESLRRLLIEPEESSAR